jgi:DNA-binding IscR family transcriptional regulator
MVRQRDIQKHCAFDALEGFISADAWTAVRILGALAARPAKLPEICRHAASSAPQTHALLDILTRQGLVRRSNGGPFVLTSSAQAISITDIVTAVDGNIWRHGPQDEPPEIEDILLRITSATVAILDNFSLAEAAEP